MQRWRHWDFLTSSLTPFLTPDIFALICTCFAVLQSSPLSLEACTLSFAHRGALRTTLRDPAKSVARFSSISSSSSPHFNHCNSNYSLPEMAARKSKLASSVQGLTIEMPREYLEHALCKQVNIAHTQSFVSKLTSNIVEPWVTS